MIKAVFFDFYNTLVRFWPPVEEVQAAACRELGISITKEGVQRGYSLADDYFSRENSRSSLNRRSEGDRDQFFARYEQMILKGAGVDVTLDLAQSVWQMTTLIPKSFVTFDDVVPTLRRLKEDGLILGVLSNLNRDMGSMMRALDIEGYLDFCITSREVGAEKPHPLIFLVALDRAGVNPGEAAHVGDQYHSDVQGARAVGITPLLLDRGGWYADVNSCQKVQSLLEVGPRIAGI